MDDGLAKLSGAIVRLNTVWGFASQTVLSILHFLASYPPHCDGGQGCADAERPDETGRVF